MKRQWYKSLFQKQEARPCLEEILRQEMEPQLQLYALADAAREPDLVSAAREDFGLQGATLFHGPLADKLDHVAPHLFCLPPDSAFLVVWAEYLGRSAGILLLTAAPLHELWGHLRGLFIATDEQEREYAFRFYDPRVFRLYAPTCTAEDAREFFGPIRKILVEDDQDEVLLRCTPGENGIVVTPLVFQASDPAAPQAGRHT